MHEPSIPARRFVRGGLALGFLSLLFAAAAAVSYSRLAVSRRPAESFAREFSIDLRRPVDAETARLAPTGDLAADVLADSALRDLEEAAPSGPIDPETARAWKRVESRRLEEIRAARELLLDALVTRPGSATHRLLLGRLSLGERRLDRAGNRRVSEEIWKMPLRAAAAAAPELDAVWAAMATGLLDGWSALSPSERREAPTILRRAFMDSSVVARQFTEVRRRWGSQAFSFLPDGIGPLSAAVASLESEAPIPEAYSLLKRLERSTRIDRARRLERIEVLHRRGDTDRVRSALVEFTFHHQAELSDDAAGRRQTARILEVWPPDGEPAPWASDPRGALIRFFLRGRAGDVSAGALARAADALSAVPPFVSAEIQLLYGNFAEAEELARSRSAIPDPDWTPYFVRLARRYLSTGRFAEAVAVLAGLTEEAADPCGVLSARRDVALGMGDQAQARALSEQLAVRGKSTQSGTASSQVTTLLCLSSEEAGTGSLAVTVESAGPSVAAYGWDGARTGLVYLPRKRRFQTPMPREPGSHTFTVLRLFGGDIRVSETGLPG